MYSEEDRLDTFYGWTNPFFTPEELARSGLYYLGFGDWVQCAFCKIELGGWEVGDQVFGGHLSFSPNCPLLNGRPTQNIPIQESIFVEDIILAVKALSQSFSNIETNNLDYRKKTDRLKSFKDWPKHMRQKPTELSEAGFFYLGKGDQVTCFSCSIMLKDWEEDDVPWEEHVWHSEDCQYLYEVKSAYYIKSVKQKLKGIDVQPSKNTIPRRANPPPPKLQSKNTNNNTNSSIQVQKLKGIDVQSSKNTIPRRANPPPAKLQSENTNNNTNIQVQPFSKAQNHTIIKDTSDLKRSKACCDLSCGKCSISMNSCTIC